MAKKRLFSVSIETEIYVYADSKKQAELVAQKSINEIDFYDFDCFANLAAKCDFNVEWKDCQPFTESRYDYTPTCDQIYKEDKEELEIEKRQTKLFE